MKRYIMALVLFLFAGGILSAQQTTVNPGVISYQGIVTSGDGSPLIDGEYPITVTIYGDEAGTVKIWQDTYMAPVQGGVFSLYLGSGKNPLPAPSQMDRAMWIGTQVAGGDEMRPLTRLSSSPFALNVPDNAITTDKLADGAVTAEKVNLDYISGVSVNGKKIEINGRMLNIQAGKDIDISFDEHTQSLVIGAPASKAGEVKDGKGSREVQTAPFDVWGAQGDKVDVLTGATTAATPADWIGPRTTPDFNIRVNSLQIMSYQQKIPGTTSNVVGGDPGNSVSANAIGNVIAGGGGAAVNNTITGDRYNVIGGGISNRIDHANSYYGGVGGGQDNVIGTAALSATHATISGGQGNRAGGNHSTVSGGQSNSASVAHSSVGGGNTNRVFAPFGSIDGGGNNTINHANSIYGAINGGQLNEIATTTAGASHSTVGGGFTNRVFGSYGSIDGGQNNTIFHSSSSHGSINGGQGNEIGTTTFFASHATVGGGRQNRTLSQYSTISGGFANFISTGSTYGTIGGGVGNSFSGIAHTIAGGSGNSIDGDLNTIGGGEANVITNGTRAATIPGGEQLFAQSYGQTVIGVLNIPKGNVNPGDPVNDEPIFIVGNGIQGSNSNAFEVSYNGHSTVFHNTGGATPVVYGGTYADNVILAWGNIDQGGGRICDFGVRNVSQLGTGWYQIELDVVDPDGNPIQINCGSVTATVANTDPPGSGNFRCAMINVSQIQNNLFDVYIVDPGCNPIDEAFNFKVTGRP